MEQVKFLAGTISSITSVHSCEEGYQPQWETTFFICIAGTLELMSETKTHDILCNPTSAKISFSDDFSPKIKNSGCTSYVQTIIAEKYLPVLNLVQKFLVLSVQK